VNNSNDVFTEFGLDDLDQGGANGLLRLAFGVMLFVLWALNAWTTGEFFRSYGAAIGDQFGAEVAPLFAFLFGIVVIDVAYAGWIYFPVKLADAREQLAVGLGTAVLLFCMSLTATGVYISLTNELARNWLADGEVIRTLSIAGTAIFALSLSVNAIGLLLWQILGAGWKQSRTATQMRALILERRADIDRERAEMVTRQTLRDIRRQMPAAADALAEANRRRYLESYQLGALPTRAQQDEPAPPTADGIGFHLINPQQRPPDDLMAWLRANPDFLANRRGGNR
jgi:hypothetical protein